MQLLWFILLLGVLITVHEAGHFLLAKLLDVKVIRLSIGFGPRLFSFRRGETEYAISAVPLGGYVKMLGEESSDEVEPEDEGRAFHQKPLWQRLAIVLAGPAANLLLPSVIYFQFYAGEATARSATVGTVFAGQPADGVLQPGDRVVAIDDAPVRYWEDVNRAVTAAAGQDLRITVERPGEDKPLTKVVTPRAHERRDVLGNTERIGLLGVAPHFQLPAIGLERVAGEPSPAERAGLRTFDVVTSVQGRPVATWSELERALAQNRGEAIVVTYLRRPPAPDGRRPSLGFAAVSRLEPGVAQIFPARSDGNGPFRYDTGIRSADLYLDSVEPGSPAARAGLEPGDALTTLDGQPLRHWELFTQALDDHRERSFTLGWRTRSGESRAATVKLEPRRERDEYQAEETQYVFGGEPYRAVRPVPSVAIEARLGWALRRAAETTVQTTGMMVRVIARLVAARLPMSEVGGPIMIYHVAGVAAAHGTDQFLAMLALVSLNLGLLNLLPVPLLDGGHILFFAVEAVRQRPVGRRVRERATWIGMAVLGALLLLALRNDILRYWFPR